MSSFTENLIVSPLKDGKKWVVRKEFFYEVGFEGSGDIVVVPVGFITDFTSVPKLFWGIFPKWDRYGKASVVHDYLYYSHEKTQEEADYIFYEGMIVLGVEEYKAKMLYAAVKVFGKSRYNEPKSLIMSHLGNNIEIPDMKKL